MRETLCIVVSRDRYHDLIRALEVLRNLHPRATTQQLADLIFEIGIQTILKETTQ
jgi:hypothetical protein